MKFQKKLLRNNSMMLAITFNLFLLLPPVITTYIMKFSDRPNIGHLHNFGLAVYRAILPAIIVLIALYCLSEAKSCLNFLITTVQILIVNLVLHSLLYLLFQILFKEEYLSGSQFIFSQMFWINRLNHIALFLLAFLVSIVKDIYNKYANKRITKALYIVGIFSALVVFLFLESIFFILYYDRFHFLIDERIHISFIQTTFLPFILILIGHYCRERRMPALNLLVIYTSSLVLSIITFELLGALGLDFSRQATSGGYIFIFEFSVFYSFAAFIFVLCFIAFCKKNNRLMLFNVSCIPFAFFYPYFLSALIASGQSNDFFHAYGYGKVLHAFSDMLGDHRYFQLFIMLFITTVNIIWQYYIDKNTDSQKLNLLKKQN